MTIALAILCLALVGLLVLRERAAARHDEVATRLVVQVQDHAAEERKRHAEERRELYQRIQAPDVAVAEAVREARGPYEKRKPRGHDHDIHAEVDGG